MGGGSWIRLCSSFQKPCLASFRGGWPVTVPKNPILTLKYYNITLYSFTVTICYCQSEVSLMHANDLDIRICLVWVGQASDCSYKVYRSLLSSSLSFLPKFSCRAAMSRWQFSGIGA